MAKGNDTEIKDALTPWEGYAKKRVEEYIKNRLASIDATLSGKRGAVHVSDTMTAEGYYELWAFDSEDDYAAYRAAEDKTDPDVAALLKSREIIPISAEQADVVMVSLSRAEGQESSVMALDGVVKLNLTYASTRYNPVDKTTEDNGETATLTVQARTSDTQPWAVIKTLTGVEPGNVTVDLSELLTKEVTYRVRVQAVGVDSGKMSVWVNFASVIRTDVALTLATDVTAAQMPANGMQLDFRHTGSVDRTLHVRVYDKTGTSIRTQSRALGNAPSGDTTTKVTFTDTAADAVKVSDAGVHKVEAWMTVDGRQGVSTDTLHAQIIMAGGDVPIVAVNDVATSLVNWGEGIAARYAVWAPSGYGDVAIRFALELADKTVLWSREVSAASGASDAIVATPEIDGISEDTIDARLRVYVGGSATPIHDSAVAIDNSRSLAPVAGAAFVLDPRTRDNYTSPSDIINAATGERVDASFDNMAFSTASGWIADESGVRCLRIPAGSRLTLSALKPFADFSTGSGVASPAMTLEMDVCIRNIADASKVIMDASAPLTLDSVTVPVGLEMRGLEATVMTTAATDRHNQDIALAEGVRRHIAVNIIPDLRGEGVNYVRIFIDGICSREFSYNAASDFATAADAPLTLGGEGADIDIYGIRFYRKGLGEAEIRRDRIATEPTLEGKLALAAANDIVDGSGAVSYDAVKGKLPTIKWIGSRETRYGDTKKTAFTGNMLIDFPGDPGHSGLLTNLTVKGQGTSSMTYYRWNQGYTFGDDSVWTDGNGVQHSDGYRLRTGLPAARKLVGKVNYASSPQTHKMGSCELYDTLWKCIIKSNGYITEEDRSLRVAVPQEPVLFFVQESENNTPRFVGLMTFGPGKGDKPTFGFDAELRPGYLCLEGADNGRDIVMHRAPWTEDVTVDGEDFMFAGQKQLSLVGGALTDANIAKFRDNFNFVYSHFHDIARWEGDSASLYQSAAADRSKNYWLDGAAALAAGERDTLHRYDQASGRWVPAGHVKTAGAWATVTLDRSGTTATGDALTAYYRQQRVQDFKAHAAEHFNVSEILFVMCFCKLIAASDNRGKNTYLYLRPEGTLGAHQDDLDTIFAINNTGQRLKPYWCEEHDKDASSGTYYWNSEDNALYCLMELAFAEEQREMMRSILDALVAIAHEHGRETVADAFDILYFDRVADVFPAVAYNENARISYEAAATAMKNNLYANGTDPLSQSLGNQIDAERQWVKQRIMYLASWCAWGDFASRDGAGASGSLNFRSVLTTAGARPSYSFDLTAHNAVYPSFAVGSTLTRGTDDGEARRMMEGETAHFDIGSSDGNTNVFVNGVNALRSLGDFTGVPLSGRLTVASGTLQEFVVDASEQVCEFRPTAMEFVTPMLSVLKLRGASTVSGIIDLSSGSRLREVDLRDCPNVTAVSLKPSSTLASLQLGSGITQLVLDGMPSLAELTLQGYKNITRMSVTGCPKLKDKMKQLTEAVLTAQASDRRLSYLALDPVAWTGASLALIEGIATVAECHLTGSIALATNVKPSFAARCGWIDLFGDTEADDAPLRIIVDPSQSHALSSVTIQGEAYVPATGLVTFKAIPNNTNANAFRKVEWEVEASPANAASLDASSRAETAVVRVARTGSEDDENPPKFTIKLTITRNDGTTVEAQREIFCYRPKLKPGYFIYADGSWGPDYDLGIPEKTAVAYCFFVNPQKYSDCRVMALANIGSICTVWGPKLAEVSGRTFDADFPGVVPATKMLSSRTYKAKGDYELAGGVLVDKTNVANGYYKAFPSSDIFGYGLANISAEFINDGFGNVPSEWSVDFDADDVKALCGQSVPAGMLETLRIVRHRNLVLDDSHVSAERPSAVSGVRTEYQHLVSLLQSCSTDIDRYFYYPAASFCHAYTPSVNGVALSPQLGVHKWYLPTPAEMVRIFWAVYFGANYPPEEGGPERLFENFPGSPVPTKVVTCCRSATNKQDNVAMVDVNMYAAGDNSHMAGGVSNVYNNQNHPLRPVAAFDPTLEE